MVLQKKYAYISFLEYYWVWRIRLGPPGELKEKLFNIDTLKKQQSNGGYSGANVAENGIRGKRLLFPPMPKPKKIYHTINEICNARKNTTA